MLDQEIDRERDMHIDGVRKRETKERQIETYRETERLKEIVRGGKGGTII